MTDDAPENPKPDRGDYSPAGQYKRMNAKYSVVMVGGSTVVFSRDADGEPIYQSFDAFRKFQSAWSMTYAVVDADKNQVPKTEPKGDWWLNQRVGIPRSQYEGVKYAPWCDDQVIDGCLNLWTGFAVDAVPGDKHVTFLAHIRDNICAGDADHYTYLLGWLASRIQRRKKPAGVSVVLKSETEGTGKGFFVHAIGHLFGRHYKHITNAEHLIGRFNSHLQDCQLLFADEAFFAGVKSHNGLLKTLITEPTITIELKGINVRAGCPNYMGIIIASNNAFVVPAGHSARRYFVLEVSTARLQDVAYFKSIERELESGGYESLLAFLLAYDLSDFEILAVPQTAALAEQKQFSLSPEEQWWSMVLQDGVLPGAWPRRPSIAFSAPLFDNARARSPRLRETSDHALANFVRKQCGAVSHRDAKANGWRFPPLIECRKAWAQRYAGTTFPDPATDWFGAPHDDREVDHDLPF